MRTPTKGTCSFAVGHASNGTIAGSLWGTFRHGSVCVTRPSDPPVACGHRLSFLSFVITV